MKITEVKVTPISIPRSSALTTSYGIGRDTSESVIVEVMTDEGLIGNGQSAGQGQATEAVVSMIRNQFAPAIIGEDPMNIEHLNVNLHSVLRGHLSSRAAIELALWDLEGKALGVPVYQLLGGRVREGVNLMGFVGRDKPEVMAEEAVKTLDETPYPVLKMKVGIDPKQDVACYRVVAEAMDDRALIQVDGNTGYTIAEAIPALTTMQAIGGLGTIEQPVASLEDLADLARRISVPIMVDEAINAPPDAIAVVRSRAASMALMKITKHGGILNVQKIAAIFESAGLTLSMAVYFDLMAAAAAHLSAALPCVRWPSPATVLKDTILTEPLEVEGLILEAPDKPGFGVEFDQEKIEKYRLDR